MYIMWNARLDESQARIKIVGININNLRYADDTSLIAESEEELKSLLMTVKEESEKPAWNSTFKKLRSWLPVLSLHDKQEEKKVETLTDFIFLAPKSLDGDYSHEIKGLLLLGRKAMTNPDSILKSRDITLPTKVHIVKTMVFPVVMYGCERWTIKKAECWRTDVFELWCWRRFLRVPWTARRSNQSILKEINP